MGGPRNVSKLGSFLGLWGASWGKALREGRREGQEKEEELAVAVEAGRWSESVADKRARLRMFPLHLCPGT